MKKQLATATKPKVKVIVPQINYKSVLARYKDIAKKNAHFDSLTDEGKRLEIAWDALQLVLQGIRPAEGHYWNSKLQILALVAKDSAGLCQSLNNVDIPKCSVCQRGLMMMSQIRIGNKISPTLYDVTHLSQGSISTVRGFRMMDMFAMEEEYENNAYHHPHKSRTKEKLANICCNVLVNGNFNVSDRTDYIQIVMV